MHTYSQTLGLLDGIHDGYSGCCEGYNNPSYEAYPNLGPIPTGHYSIGPAFTHALAGPLTMRLVPISDTETFGRDGFMIHGDTDAHAKNPTAENSCSHGCIVVGHSVRAALAVSNDRLLWVIR